VGQGRAGSNIRGHSLGISNALEQLKKQENQLQIVDLAFQHRDNTISFIGVSDCNPERNLGDYQNMGYFLLTGNQQKAVVIDPGLREAGWLKDALGIQECDVIFTHFHLDHWIGYEAFSNQRIFASPLCKTVLTQMVGAERTGKSIFVEGRLNDYNRRPLPLRAVNDAERLLPIRESISTVTDVLPYKNRDFGLDFFELPYGQTEGTLYGLLETEGLKTLFASDLFVMINNRMWQGNVARGRFPCHITGLGSKGGAKGRSFCFLLYSAICRCITTAFLILRAPGRFKQGTFILLRKMQQEPSPLQSQSSST
jgi:glyoxylase-like metal-dependent hydrolase (beta-lactamase superfamily II)